MKKSQKKVASTMDERAQLINLRNLICMLIQFDYGC